jgi:hypothetical protein
MFFLNQGAEMEDNILALCAAIRATWWTLLLASTLRRLRVINSADGFLPKRAQIFVPRFCP